MKVSHIKVLGKCLKCESFQFINFYEMVGFVYCSCCFMYDLEMQLSVLFKQCSDFQMKG